MALTPDFNELVGLNCFICYLSIIWIALPSLDLFVYFRVLGEARRSYIKLGGSGSGNFQGRLCLKVHLRLEPRLKGKFF